MSFCRTEETAQAAGGLCRWPLAAMPLRWSIEQVPPQFDREGYAEIIRTAFAAWEAVCGLTTRQSDDRPNIVFQLRRIDGQNGVLAQAQLPCGNVTSSTRLWCQVDVGESWGSYAGPLTGRHMDILRVLMHEIGHNLGISHEQTRGTRALMDPSVSEIRALQPWDIAQAVARYGPPEPEKPIPGKPSPGKSQTIDLGFIHLHVPPAATDLFSVGIK